MKQIIVAAGQKKNAFYKKITDSENGTDAEN
jgi:hypothetical protein